MRLQHKDRVGSCVFTTRALVEAGSANKDNESAESLGSLSRTSNLDTRAYLISEELWPSASPVL